MDIAMLVSGGVDSSVSLRLLRDAGHDIVAFYLKIWLEDELAFLGECPWEDDLNYVRSVCEAAGVPLEIANLQKEYWEGIVSYVIAEAKAGRTPNPDVFCNSRIKFGMFYDRFGHDFDKVATGHYAQIEEFSSPSSLLSAPLIPGAGMVSDILSEERKESRTTASPGRSCAREERGGPENPSNTPDHRCFLKKSPDPVKDQTYFLSQLKQEQVAKALFPIGGFRKSAVRALASDYRLPNAERKDSQGICFLGTIAFDKFLEHYLGTKEGSIVDMKTGRVLGKHRGYWFHTIGQRRGLGLSGGPWYVAGKDVASNAVFVSNAWRSEEMERSEFSVRDLNWISGSSPQKERLSVKIRHGAREYPCQVALQESGMFQVRIDGSDRGIAAGQVAAFYDGEYCLGGGIIAE